MCLFQTWYGLRDYEVEDRINDSISFVYFNGLAIFQSAQDHIKLSRFRTLLTKAGCYELLFQEVNNQLEQYEIIVKTRIIVDTIIVDSPIET